MLIGNRYSESKLYRGIKYYDHIPLTSGDLHEYADIVQIKNELLFNNTIGSGLINKPTIISSSTGITLGDPAVVLIDGDIALIGRDAGEIVKASDVTSSNITEGYFCIVGWYQSLTANSTLRAYGGVNNSIITNDIYDSNLGMQTSTRYQLRWDTILIDKSSFDSYGNVSISIPKRSATGAITSGSVSLTTSKVGNIRKATKPASMDYAVSDLYIVPILYYKYENNNFTSIRSVSKGFGVSVVKSSTQPSILSDEGTIWFNTTNSKFYMFLEGRGFVPISPDVSLTQNYNVVTIEEATTTPKNIRINIGIESYTENDVLQVLYEGLVLTEGVHYTLHASSKYVTLIGFTTEVGDKITFLSSKVVGSESDSANASTIKDTVTGKNYKLKVTNGVLGIEEIS